MMRRKKEKDKNKKYFDIYQQNKKFNNKNKTKTKPKPKQNTKTMNPSKNRQNGISRFFQLRCLFQFLKVSELLSDWRQVRPYYKHNKNARILFFSFFPTFSLDSCCIFAFCVGKRVVGVFVNFSTKNSSPTPLFSQTKKKKKKKRKKRKKKDDFRATTQLF